MRTQEIEDILESVLNACQLRVAILSDVEYCGSWYDREPTTDAGQFHLIKSGECLMSGPMLEEPVRLTGGDFAVFPHGRRHTLLSTAPPGSPPSMGFTSMLCGELEFIKDPNNPVLDALPQCLIVHARDGGDTYRTLADLLVATSRDHGFGRQLGMNKLADCLFTMAVCEYARQGVHSHGIFAGMADARLVRALHVIHAQPGNDWTLHRLAAIANMSRSAFALRFTEVMGIAPMRYLTHWRITHAKRLLKNPRLSIAAIAERVGYRSEAAFRRLFKRLEGTGVSTLRAAVRSEAGGDE